MKFQLKKYRRVMSHDTEEWCKIWIKTNFLFQKWHEFGELIRVLKSLKFFYFDWSLLCKVYNVWSKKVQRIYISWQWRVMQNLQFGKWHEEFGKFSPEHKKISKLGPWWHPFVRIYTGELCVMRIKNDAKIEEVQNWHEEFDEFWPKHSKISIICTLMGCFWPKYIMFELK